MPRLYWTRSGQRRLLDRYAVLLRDCPVQNETRRVSTGIGETFILCSGLEESPPLVLLHGGNTNSLMWLRSLPAWTRRFRVYAVDTPGDPGFSAPTRPPFNSDAYTRWLDDVWRELGITRAAVVAASFGGWIALDYLVHRPEKFERLALLAPAGIVRMDPVSQFKVAALTMLGASGRRKALEISFGVNADGFDEAARDYVQFQGLVQTRFISRIKLPAVIPDVSLRGINTPMMVVLGERDIFFPADRMQQRLSACVPGAQVHRLAGVGHGLGDPTDLVTRFLMQGLAP